MPKWNVEYTPSRQRDSRCHFGTDDPVACEEFISELLECRSHIHAIKHEGVELPRADFDRLVKTAGSMLASRHVCDSLGIKPEEAHHRFGFAA